MNFKEILELIDKVADKEISSVEIEQAGTKVKIEGKKTHAPVIASYSPSESSEKIAPAVAAPAAPPTEKEVADRKKKDEEESEAGLHIITSPIVGTFYRAANPEAESFGNPGDRISKGKVLCIIEAMKLMNEIESDVDGEILEIYPQNAQAVEFGEPLFAVRIAGS